MKLLFDFFPILLFFVTYKLFNIYLATGVAMIASFLQVISHWIKYRYFESLHIITLVIILILGSVTIVFHNTMFIKWKPTAVYWLFALFFLSTQFIGNKTLVQRMMDNKLTLPKLIWIRLNLSWTVFFTTMGIANLYVVYNFSTNAWVNFKLFGTLGITLIFIILQAVYIAKYTGK
ncbi:MAG: septation protein A [Coxiella sp. DG_40]|nr:MAG: septation protein A [Coxiella sp. DG_40]